MKVKVIKTFKDIHTDKLHRKGDEFTCTKKRYTEIISKGKYVEEIKDTNAADETETEETAE